MAAEEKVTIDIDAKIDSAKTMKDLRELKQLLKETAAGGDDFKKLSGGIRDLGDKLEEAKVGANDFAGALEEAPGPVGMLGKGLRSLEIATSSWGAALKATGIGLIVGLIGGLVAAFTKTEGSLKKLEPITIAFEKTLGGVVSAVEPLLEGFAELALKVMPYVTEAFKVVYSAMTAVFQSLGKIGQAVGKLIKGDFAGAWDTAKESVTGFKDNFVKAEARFEKGYQKTTATQKKNLDEQEKNRQDALNKRLKELDAQDKLDASQLAKAKADAMKFADTEQEKLDVEKKFFEKSFALRRQDLLDKQKLYGKGTDEYKGFQAELNSLDAERTTTISAFGDKQKEITKAAQKEIYDAELKTLELRKSQGLVTEEEYQKALYDTAIKYKQNEQDALIKYEAFKTEQRKKSAEDARVIAVGELQDEIDKLKAKNDLIANDFAEDQLRLEMIKTNLQTQKQIELENLELTEKEKNEIIKKYAKEEQEIDKQVTDSKIQELEARKTAQFQFAQAVGSVLGQLSGLFEKGTKAAKIAALAEIAIGTGVGFINALDIAQKSAKGTGPAAAFAFPIFYATQVAAVLAAASKAKSILSTSGGGGGGGASIGGGGSVSAPEIKFQGRTAIPTPEAQTGNNINPTAQIAQSLSNASGKPLKAYVVSNDISSAQALDRRTTRASTFSAG